MKNYIGTKTLNAKPMTRDEYNTLRGWPTPADENGSDEGYLVEYTDGGKPNVEGFAGYVSWSPKEQFENAYRETSGMNFGLAMEAMKKGLRVARKGWNERGIFIYRVPANKYPASRNLLETMKGVYEDDLVPYQSYTAMKTVDNTVVPWTCSQTDRDADDWVIVENPAIGVA